MNKRMIIAVLCILLTLGMNAQAEKPIKKTSTWHTQSGNKNTNSNTQINSGQISKSEALDIVKARLRQMNKDCPEE